MSRPGALAVCLGLSLAALPALADAPTTMNFQGRLTDTSPSQLPIDATLPMEFRIHDALIGGSQLWSESWVGVTVSDGLFSVILGSNGTPLTEAVFAGPDRFLEIVVNAEVLSPRQTLSAVAYSQQAKNSDSLGGSPASSWQMSLAGNCAPGFYLQQILADGTTVCAPDADSGGDITGVGAGAGLTGGGASGTTTLSVDFGGTGFADAAARSDHNHDGGPVPPTSAQRAILTGLASQVDGWISGNETLSAQLVVHNQLVINPTVTQIVPTPSANGFPEQDPTGGIITFTTLFTAAAPLLEWMEQAISIGPENNALPDPVLALKDEVGQTVRSIQLTNAWPMSWSLDYLPSGDPIVNIKIAAQLMSVPVIP